jgi:hypothetical protein
VLLSLLGRVEVSQDRDFDLPPVFWSLSEAWTKACACRGPQ